MTRLLLCCAAAAMAAFANPTYTIDYDTPFQVVGPNDTVNVYITVTNTGAAAALFEYGGLDMLGGNWPAEYNEVSPSFNPPDTLLNPGDTWNLLFASYAPDGPAPLGNYFIEYLAIRFCDANEQDCDDVVVEALPSFAWEVAEVPEPSALLLMGAGLAGLGWLRRLKAAGGSMVS